MNHNSPLAQIKVLRYDPAKDQNPYFQDYAVPVADTKMSLLQALELIYKEQDPTLAFRRFCCGLQTCNSCMMLVNGKRAHACMTLLHPGMEVEVAPLPGRQVLRDLVVEDRPVGKDN